MTGDEFELVELRKPAEVTLMPPERVNVRLSLIGHYRDTGWQVAFQAASFPLQFNEPEFTQTGLAFTVEKTHLEAYIEELKKRVSSANQIFQEYVLPRRQAGESQWQAKMEAVEREREEVRSQIDKLL